jgi:hypothetical protein
MAPRSCRAAVVVATVLLLLPCTQASAAASGAVAPEATPGAAQSTEPGTTSAGEGTAGDGGVLAAVDDAAPPAGEAPTEALSQPGVIRQGASDQPPGPPAGAPVAPAPAEPATDRPARVSDEQSPPQSESRSAGPAAAPPSPPVRPAPPPPVKADASTVAATSPAPPAEPPAPAPKDRGAAPPRSKSEPDLEQLLSDADRGLREVRGQIGAFKRRLDAGISPPTAGVLRLREGLDRVTPVLLALEAQLGPITRLAPRLKHLLRRVRSRLDGTHGSAVGLIAALDRSGPEGSALRLLLQELKRFVALDPISAPAPGRTPATSEPGIAPPSPAPYAAYTPIEAPAAATPRHDAAPHPSEGRGHGRRDTRHEDRGGAGEAPPWSAAPGSATASAGAFAVAGVVSLAALLIALALPGLRVRLDLLAGRPYRATFLTPLERPG